MAGIVPLALQLAVRAPMVTNKTRMEPIGFIPSKVIFNKSLKENFFIRPYEKNSTNPKDNV